MRIVFGFLFTVSFFHIVAGAHIERPKDCAGLLIDHVNRYKSDPYSFQAWLQLPSDLDERESATVLVRLSSVGLSSGLAGLGDLGLGQSAIDVKTLRNFGTFTDGAFFAVIDGKKAALLAAHEYIRGRFPQGILSYQILGASRGKRSFSLATPERLLEIGAKNPGGELVLDAELTGDWPYSRAAIFNPATASTVFIYSKADLDGVSQSLFHGLGIEYLEAPESVSLFEWWIGQTRLKEKRSYVVEWRGFFLISAEAFGGLKSLGGKGLDPSGSSEAGVAMDKELASALAAEMGLCEFAVCVHEIPPPSTSPTGRAEAPGNVDAKLYLEPFVELMKRERPDMSYWSAKSPIQAYFETIFERAIPHAELNAAKEALYRIPFKKDDKRNARKGGMAQSRFVDAIRILAGHLNVEDRSDREPTPWIRDVVKAYELQTSHGAAARTEPVAKVAEPPAEKPLPRPLRVSISDWSVKRQYEKLKLDPSKPTVIITIFGTPAWVALDNQYLLLKGADTAIATIEAQTEKALPDGVKRQLADLAAQPRLAKVERFNRMAYNDGMKRMYSWAESREVKVFASSDEMRKPLTEQSQLIMVPLSSIQANERANQQVLPESKPEAQAPPPVPVPVPVPMPMPMPMPVHSPAFAKSASPPAPHPPPLTLRPNIFTVTFTQDITASIPPTVDRADLKTFLLEYAHLALPAQGRNRDAYELIYFNARTEHCYYVSFRQRRSPEARPMDQIEVLGLDRLSDVAAGKEFWKAMAEKLTLGREKVWLGKDKFVQAGKGRFDTIHISGPVLAKIMIKHRISRKQILLVLNQVRIASRQAEGDYVSRPTFDGEVYRVGLVVSSNKELHVSTLYIPGKR